MKPFTAERMVRTHHFELPMAPGAALHFFTPEGERAWAKGWDPRYLHPRDGRATAGMVFTTGDGADETLWTMTRHEPESGVVEYLRATVTYALTALTAQGNEALLALAAAAYERFIESWGASIRDATTT